MSKMIQVRDVPDRIHQELKRRARARRRTLSDYIRDILERELSRPEPDVVFRAVAAAEPVDLGMPASDLIHEDRRTRERSA